jgi:hypothetical protein
VEFPQPGFQRRTEPARQTILLSEIDDVKLAAGRQCRKRCVDGGLPVGDHRQGIGDHDPVETFRAKISGQKGGGIGDAEIGHLRHAVEGTASAQQHLLRDVEPKELGRGKAPMREQQVAPRAAADFEQRTTERHVQAVDRPVAAEKIVFASEVVDVPLVAVHAVHQAGMAVRRCIDVSLGAAHALLP